MELGQAVKFQRKPDDVVDATIIGFESVAEGLLPKLRLAFLEPDRASQLGGAEWRHSFDQAWAVPYLRSEEGEATGRGFSLLPSEEALTSRDEVIHSLNGELGRLTTELAQTTEGRDQALQQIADANKAPSAADLDAVADDQKQAKATTKRTSGV